MQTVTVTVTARPDLAADPCVRAIVDAQAEATGRFARTQVDNFMRLGWTRAVAGGTLTPWLRAEWSHEFQGSSRQALDYADIGGAATFGFETQGWGREQFDVSVGSSLDLDGDWSIGGEIGVHAADKEKASTARVQLRKQF